MSNNNFVRDNIQILLHQLFHVYDKDHTINSKLILPIETKGQQISENKQIRGAIPPPPIEYENDSKKYLYCT